MASGTRGNKTETQMDSDGNSQEMTLNGEYCIGSGRPEKVFYARQWRRVARPVPRGNGWKMNRCKVAPEDRRILNGHDFDAYKVWVSRNAWTEARAGQEL